MPRKTPAADEAVTEQTTVNSDPMAANPSADHALAEQDAEAAAAEAAAAEEAATEQTDEAVNDQPVVELVVMRRDAPLHEDGPTEAEVHPDEVANWLQYGWELKPDAEDQL